MLKISKSGLPLDLYWHIITTRAPDGANNWVNLPKCWVNLLIQCVNIYPNCLFTQSLHKVCNDWVNLPILWVNLDICCVVTQSLKDCVTVKKNYPYIVSISRRVITLSLHKMCTNC